MLPAVVGLPTGPDLVRNKTVLDLGSGSGVAAIAAARAGAGKVLACDTDPDARAATATNAALNSVDVKIYAMQDFDIVWLFAGWIDSCPDREAADLEKRCAHVSSLWVA